MTIENTNMPPPPKPLAETQAGMAANYPVVPRPHKTTLCVLVPTKNESGNVELLLKRIEGATQDIDAEVLFVDDSTDDTPQVIRALSEQFDMPVSVIARPPERRVGGLGGAVVEGLRNTQASWVCVMDGDLQHPPELLPRLLEQAERTDSDLVVASRDFSQGNPNGLSLLRSLVSRVLIMLARLLFPASLRTVSDPLTGFFLLRRDAIEIEQMHPRGFKILLEILVRFPGLRVSETIFQFGKRHAGKSKASAREALRYLVLLWNLHLSTGSGRFVRFIAVGVSGLLVNSLAMGIVTEWLGILYIISAAMATLASTSWNFTLTELWVFSDRRHQPGLVKRALQFFTVNFIMLALREPIIVALTELLNIHYLASNLISFGVMSLVRYVAADRWIWGMKKSTKKTPPEFSLNPYPETQKTVPQRGGGPVIEPYTYTIHGIVTIVSEVALPELEQFRTDERISAPTVRVRIDHLSGNQGANGSLAMNGAQRIRYDEGLGPLGFSAEIKRGEAVEVLASPLLRYSPHVLYTNLVEPILRWTFVQKGYALVHGACVTFEGKAYLVTARTDTGKTTTLLHILNRQRRASDNAAFVSDDLTIVAPDGRVFIYPKPLTISSHTLKAVKNAKLPLGNRLALPFQSRIHSRGGRRFALTLTRSILPMATINALVQWVIPPPKYHIQQLVPQVKLVKEARLAGVFVIERGETATMPLNEQEGLEILLSNCEDAYGFPPYHSIKDFLRNPGDHDLAEDEKKIIASAFRNVPATLIRSKDLDWWKRIPAFVGGAVADSFNAIREGGSRTNGYHTNGSLKASRQQQ